MRRRRFGRERPGPSNPEIVRLVEEVTGLMFPRLDDHCSITLARAQVLALLRMAEQRGSAVMVLEGLQEAFRPLERLPEHSAL